MEENLDDFEAHFMTFKGLIFEKYTNNSEPRIVTKETPKPEVKTCSVLLKKTTVSY
jgi:hypothetical protein